MSFQEIKKRGYINYFPCRKLSTFHAFRPKAVNEYVELAGLLACCTSGFLPILQQWFFSESLCFNKTQNQLTATGIAPDLNRIPF